MKITFTGTSYKNGQSILANNELRIKYPLLENIYIHKPNFFEDKDCLEIAYEFLDESKGYKESDIKKKIGLLFFRQLQEEIRFGSCFLSFVSLFDYLAITKTLIDIGVIKDKQILDIMVSEVNRKGGYDYIFSVEGDDKYNLANNLKEIIETQQKNNFVWISSKNLDTETFSNFLDLVV